MFYVYISYSSFIFILRSLKSEGKLDIEEADAEVLRISLNKTPKPFATDEMQPNNTPEMARRSKTPHYMEVDKNMNSVKQSHGSKTPGNHTPKLPALSNLDYSKKHNILEPQRTPRKAPNNVLRLEMEPPSPKEEKHKRTPSPKQSSTNKHKASPPTKGDKDSPPRKVDKHEKNDSNKHEKNEKSHVPNKKDSKDKDSSHSRNNSIKGKSDKSQKNSNGVKDKVLTQTNSKDTKANNSKSGAMDSSVLKQNNVSKNTSNKNPQGRQRSREGKRRMSIKKEASAKMRRERSGSLSLPYDPTESMYYSDDFDDSDDESDIEEGKNYFKKIFYLLSTTLMPAVLDRIFIVLFFYFYAE